MAHQRSSAHQPALNCAVLLGVWVLASAVSSPAQAPDVPLSGAYCAAERGELASDGEKPVLRFTVNALDGSVSRGMGYLSFSRDRIWFEPFSGGVLLDRGRADLKPAKEWTVYGTHTGMAELKFRNGSPWYFAQILCSVYEKGQMPAAGDPRQYQDLVEAANQFEAAVTRVRQSPPPRLPGESAGTAPAPAAAPPEVVLLEPAGDSEVATDTITVRGIAVDAKAVTLVRVAGRTAAMQPRSERAMEFWVERVPLKPGENEIEIVARNVDGAEGRAVLRVRRVATQPRLVVPVGLGVVEVVKLLEGGVTAVRMETIVRERGVSFALTEDAEVQLRQAGATDTLLLAIAKAKR